MSLQLYNTLHRREELFAPQTAGQVKMYCCGVTVYDYCHLGHARSYIIWDTVRRYLQWLGYSVEYVQNFTDIDDKILNRAKREGTSMQVVAERYIDAYKEDMVKLNILPADRYPQATGVIPEIIALIQHLIDRGCAYPVDGDVYYAVETFPTYGKLSGQQINQMEVGASGRVDHAEPKKRHPLDFVLWKAAKPDELAVYTPWDSPWGAGRPGWHIECSAMVKACFGGSIDIHTGGMDLIFPHHENEIAQSEAASQEPLSRYWMHNGFVNIQGEKMAKSLNNFTTIRDLLKTCEPMAIRLFVLQAHYRKPVDFTDETIATAQNSWSTIAEGLRFGLDYGSKLGWSMTRKPAEALDPEAKHRFQLAMDADFNTPVALSILFEIAKELNRERNLLTHEGSTRTGSEQLERQWLTLLHLSQVLGLEAHLQDSHSQSTSTVSENYIEALIQERQAARTAKNFAESDRIRDQLKAQGITLVDQAGGVTRWHRDA
jgi:cysteinyl-tRNA synthetase